MIPPPPQKKKKIISISSSQGPDLTYRNIQGSMNVLGGTVVCPKVTADLQCSLLSTLACVSADMLTLPLSAEVYRFLSASSAYRFTIQIFRFLSNLPLFNHWVLFTPSDWDWVTVCHHYINVMTAIQEIVKTCVMQSYCITGSTWQVKRLF